MTEKRKSFLMNFPFKFFLSLFMAVTMLLALPIKADAAVVYNSGLAAPVILNTADTLTLNYQYQSGYSTGPASYFVFYEGQHSVFFRLARNSNSYNYVSGLVAIPFTYSVSNYSGSGLASMSLADVAVTSSALPDDVSVAVNIYSRSGTTIGGDLYISFRDLPLLIPADFSVTFSIQAYGQGTGSYWSPPNSISCPVSFNVSNAVYAYYAYTDLAEFNSFAKWLSGCFTTIYGRLDTVNNNLATVNSTINNQANAIKANQATINTSINTQGKNITDKIQAQINNDNSNTTKTINALNANSKSEVDAANKNSQNEIDTANKNADDIMHSFDSGSQDDKNSEFDASQKQLQETEDNLFGSASGYFSGLDFSLFDIAKFTSVVSSLSFVSGLMQSLFQKMGDFGLIVTVGMVILIASKVIGVYRFSTGDHGKGG